MASLNDQGGDIRETHVQWLDDAYNASVALAVNFRNDPRAAPFLTMLADPSEHSRDDVAAAIWEWISVDYGDHPEVIALVLTGRRSLGDVMLFLVDHVAEEATVE